MLKLLAKEIKLTMHPATPLFIILSAMVLIPNYPYYVTFFYVALGIFFTCMNGRENNDIIYTLTLPVKKTDIVKARFTFAVSLEIIQFILAIPLAMLRQSFPDIPGNEAGIDANIAFFGSALIMVGLFNLVFFSMYYKNTYKVGKAFIFSSIAMAIYMLFAEASVFAVPFVRDYIDTTDDKYVEYKLPVLAVGIVAYVVLTAIAYKKSKKSFEALDQ